MPTASASTSTPAPTPAPPAEPQPTASAPPHQRETITVPVPPGYPAMSLPVPADTRIPACDILVEPITEADLIIVARELYTAFPQLWWNIHEPLSRRPLPQTRYQRFATRYKPWVTYPNYHAIKATHTPTGTFVGFAGWHAPQHHLLPANAAAGSFGTNMFRRSTHAALGYEDAGTEAWEAVDVEGWEQEFAAYDAIREEEMRGQQHWYLAPFFVVEQWRGRGVGARLMAYALEKADERGLPCYLEAFPNARPVYLRYGFEPPTAPLEVDDEEGTAKRGREMVLIRPGAQLLKGEACGV